MILALLASLLAGAEHVQLRSVEIWSEHPIRVTIEWLTIDDEGRGTVTAKSLMAVGPPMPIEFAHAPGRYARFSYEGASPRTYSTQELIAAKRLRVPDVLPGGELLLLTPQATVRPRELRVAGPVVRTLPVEAQHLSMAGVPPGEYRVTPVYEGGIEGYAREGVVTATASTVLLMPIEQVGAVQVEAALEICNPATGAGLHRLGLLKPEDPKSPIVRGQVHRTKEPRCWMTFGGLRPGTFEIFYEHRDSMLGRTQFPIEAQQVTRASVRPSTVTATGRVTLNDKPVAAAQLRFNLTGEISDSANVTTTTDAGGQYRVTLMSPGTFMIYVTGPTTAGSKRVEIVEGTNVVDFAISGGTIAVDLTGWSGKDRLQIRLQSQGSMRMVSWSRAQGTTAAFEGLTPGAYKVSVSGPWLRGPQETKTVTVGGPGSVARLTFDLSQR